MDISYENFESKCATTPLPRGYREGQHALNMLTRYRKEIAWYICGDMYLDPFFTDNKLPAFWMFLSLVWDEPNQLNYDTARQLVIENINKGSNLNP